ncbi:hypothetical protein H5123_10535 [Shewanella sp. SR43-4]|uniref:hypothetical protein n=1 Tax=Shewanella sp. SR43-4 TaxID=2760942 RepID=UPI0015F90D86|nr:hypothetical protein [Shewanella sp. SR43-4]MBB1318072.1 hypothetical protein [Shewanella sp. SR43-4]
MEYEINRVTTTLLAACEAARLPERYQVLVDKYPQVIDENAPMVSLPRKIAIMDSFGLPIRYYKAEGGYFRLNHKKFSHPHMSVTIIMLQWVSFTIGTYLDDHWRGAGMPELAHMVRYLRGETTENYQHSPLHYVWCYNETQLTQVLTELFAIFNDVCQAMPPLPPGTKVTWK